jgi:hypothetical protein
MELREQRGLDSGAGFVVWPEPIAKGLDHVIGSDAKVRVTLATFGGPFYAVAALDHLEDVLQHADHGTVRAVFAFGKPAQAVEVAEQFVSTVNEMYYHTVSEYADETA